MDIFESADVAAGKCGKLEPAQYRAFRRAPELFELRVAIMDAKKMHHMDGNTNDLKFTVEVLSHKADATLQRSERKSTDTHKRTARGSFNQWILFKDLQLYYPVPTISAPQLQKQRLVLKAWDADTFTPDDLIGSYDSARHGPDAAFDVDKLFEHAMFEVGNVRPGSTVGRKKGMRKFGKNHVFRLPDSGLRGRQKAMESCCEWCCRKRKTARVEQKPEYVELSRTRHGGVPENRGYVRMRLQLLPKQLAEDGQHQPKEMDKPTRPSVHLSNPFAALSWFLPFDLGVILPCSNMKECLCCTVTGLVVLLFVATLLTEVPKVLIHQMLGMD